MHTELVRISAFSDGALGGNPAGVYLSSKHPDDSEMQSIAARAGYSETAFVKPSEAGFRVRYFSPESEVPFCGHATIAVGAALSRRHGPGVFGLELNDATISVEGFVKNEHYFAALQSPGTSSQVAQEHVVSDALELFGYKSANLDTRIPPALANGGANHLIIALNSRQALSAMRYDLDAGRDFMNAQSLVTVMFVFAEDVNKFHSRNPFASGGVYEDSATGAATAAFAGYLRDISWAHGGQIDLIQGEDMGERSLLRAEFSDVAGSSIRVSGAARFMAVSG